MRNNTIQEQPWEPGPPLLQCVLHPGNNTLHSIDPDCPPYAKRTSCGEQTDGSWLRLTREFITEHPRTCPGCREILRQGPNQKPTGQETRE